MQGGGCVGGRVRSVGFQSPRWRGWQCRDRYHGRPGMILSSVSVPSLAGMAMQARDSNLQRPTGCAVSVPSLAGMAMQGRCARSRTRPRAVFQSPRWRGWQCRRDGWSSDPRRRSLFQSPRWRGWQCRMRREFCLRRRRSMFQSPRWRGWQCRHRTMGRGVLCTLSFSPLVGGAGNAGLVVA